MLTARRGAARARWCARRPDGESSYPRERRSSTADRVRFGRRRRLRHGALHAVRHHAGNARVPQQRYRPPRACRDASPRALAVTPTPLTQVLPSASRSRPTENGSAVFSVGGSPVAVPLGRARSARGRFVHQDLAELGAGEYFRFVFAHISARGGRVRGVELGCAGRRRQRSRCAAVGVRGRLPDARRLTAGRAAPARPAASTRAERRRRRRGAAGRRSCRRRRNGGRRRARRSERAGSRGGRFERTASCGRAGSVGTARQRVGPRPTRRMPRHRAAPIVPYAPVAAECAALMNRSRARNLAMVRPLRRPHAIDRTCSGAFRNTSAGTRSITSASRRWPSPPPSPPAQRSARALRRPRSSARTSASCR